MNLRHSILWLSLLAGCSQTLNPCPEGSAPNRLEGRCIPWADDASVSDDASIGDDATPAMDATYGLDATTDAAPPGAPPQRDAGAEDSGSTEEPVCLEEDLAAWRSFHLDGGAVDTIDVCIAQPCKTGVCDAENCLRSATGLIACHGCPAQEVSCALEFCNSACGWPGNDSECLACVCESGCVAQFEACAGATLDVCTNVHGRDARVDERVLQDTWLVRMKNATGLLQTCPLAPAPSADKAFAFTDHHSKGFTHVVAFRAADVSYLLQHKSRCGNDPCAARISPVLADGSLGRPVYSEPWTRGWDKLAFFELAQELYLLRYKTGAAPAQQESTGHLRIDRLRFTQGHASLSLELALNAPTPPTSPYAWTAIEPFVWDGATHLLYYGSSRAGEVLISRLDIDETGGLALVPVSKNLAWSRGWDIVKAFTHAGTPHVLAYKSGRISTTEEAPGSVQIFRVFSPTATSAGLSPVYQGTLSPSLTQILPYRQGGGTYLLLQNASTGDVMLRTLSADPAQWTDDLKRNFWSARWGANPIWDMLEVIQGTEESP